MQRILEHWQHTQLNEEQHNKIREVAEELQAHFEHEDGAHYRQSDLEKSVYLWLNSSIESLIEEAVFHLATGSHHLAFNRTAFKDLMSKYTPSYSPEEVEFSDAMIEAIETGKELVLV